MSQRYLLHIIDRTEWTQHSSSDSYTPVNYASEGFIHLSTKEQVLIPANRFYKGQQNLILLVVDTTLIDAKIVYENLEGGTPLFPHLYGPLPVAAVVDTIDFPCTSEGFFTTPIHPLLS